MSSELRYAGRVDQGQLKLVDRVGFARDLQSFEGQAVVITLKKYVKQRSDKQNRFYFSNFIQSQIDCFVEMWGERYDKAQIHELNKAQFWAIEHIDEETGEIIKIPCSSTNYSTVEWEEKLEIIRQFFRDKFSWELPVPNEQTDLNI